MALHVLTCLSKGVAVAWLQIQKIPPFGGLWNALQRDPDYNISTLISKMEDFCKVIFLHRDGPASSASGQSQV